jgi:hypothetical protein
MHAMPPPVPSPRRRLTFNRLLLALVFGLAAWWGVGWWLSPRALYTLKYPNDAGYPSEVMPPYFNASPLDRDGKFMLVVTSDSCDYHVVDLANGATLGSGVPRSESSSPQWRRVPDGEVSLCRLMDYSHAGGQGSVIHTDGSFRGRNCVWAYDLLSHEARLVHDDNGYPTAWASHDGSTLCQRLELPLRPFQTLTDFATPSPAVLALVAAQRVHSYSAWGKHASIVFYRFWSLKGQEYRSAITADESLRPYDYLLSEDGRWLVFTDTDLSPPFMSPRLTAAVPPPPLRETPMSDEMRCLIADLRKRTAPTVPAPPVYVRVPKELRVYDTRTGMLRFISTEHAGRLLHPGFGRPWQTILPLQHEPDRPSTSSSGKDEVTVTPIDVPSTPRRFLHLPSGKWLPVVGFPSGFQEVRGPAGAETTRWIAPGHDYPYSEDPKEMTPVWDTAADGTTRQVGALPANSAQDAVLVPGTPFVVHTQEITVLPEWLRERIASTGWFGDWISRREQRLVIRDYERGTVLWSMPRTDESTTKVAVTPTGSHLIVSSRNRAVTVVWLPTGWWLFAWPAWAGLTVAVVTLLIRRRRPALSPF